MATSALATLILLSLVSAQNQCHHTPIYLDFHDRRVDTDKSFQYGLFAGVGTPSQNLSQWPSISHNEMTIAGPDYCTDSPFEDCINRAHGIYDPLASDDHRPHDSYQSLDNVLEITNATVINQTTDTYNLFVHYYDPSPPTVTHVPNVPITVLSNYTSDQSPWFGPAGLFALGPSSTILSRLLDLDLIATRSYGLYMGTYYEPVNGLINGSLTLDPNPDFDNSSLRVTISQMTLTDSNGDEAQLLQQSQSLDAYLTTSQHEINLPESILDRFVQETNADDSGIVYSLPQDFNSTLTISFSSGLNLTFESEWLRNVSNNSPISTTASGNRPTSDSESSSLAFLGSAFFTHVYLMVNYDAPTPTFYLASALPHAPYVMTTPFCTDTVPTPAPPTDISSFAANGIAGAVIGGVIGGIGLTFLIWWLARICMQRQSWRARHPESIKGKGVQGGNVPISAFPSSPKSFHSSTTVGDNVVDNEMQIDERTRNDSNEMQSFAALNFNNGFPSGYSDVPPSSMQSFAPNHAQYQGRTDSPGSVLSEGYARLGTEVKPNVVQVQAHHHSAQPWTAIVHDANHSAGYMTPVTPLTTEPYFHSSSSTNPHALPASRHNANLDGLVSPISPPGGPMADTTIYPTPQSTHVDTEFAPPPRSEE
ncbi:hypothetical protein B0A52_03352 [Exophiala mesophila]|uniref:Peptidase A1 domain-containing protein n=1 Tax=Exophiala mesophila TaxID=212818 RepID=A0A438NBG5_EXOME|nr:hypothetical protein B0A52_03352 [Exophiala mesophila]